MSDWWVSEAIQQLQIELSRRWPDDTDADWTIGDAKHRRRRSDHNPAARSTPPNVVRAIDVRVSGKGSKDKLDRLAEDLRYRRDPRIKYVIHNRQIFSSYIARNRPVPYTWGHYSGSNPHTTHVHVSVNPSGDHDRAPWDLRAARYVKDYSVEDVLASIIRDPIVGESWSANMALTRNVQHLVGADA